MAITRPPGRRRPAAAAARRRRRPAARRRGACAAPRRSRRALPVAALALVVLIIAYLVFSGPGTTTYHLILPDAYQLVKRQHGAGRGRARRQRHEHRADQELQGRTSRSHVKSSLAPLHHGTTVQVRTPSLSSVANRYVALTPGPQSSPAYPAGATAAGHRLRHGHRPRRTVQRVEPEDAEGPAGLPAGERRTVRRRRHGSSANRPNTSRPPSRRVDHVFAAADGRPAGVHAFPGRNRQGAHHDRRPRSEQLSDLIENSNHTFEARRRTPDRAGQGLKELPRDAARRATSTSANCPPRCGALEELIERLQADDASR